jgi:hypothetical protein
LSFAGASSVSLKEALDAAHGHEHAADGSELTSEKQKEMAAKKTVDAGHNHDGHAEDHGNSMWMYASIVLFVLLLLSLVTRKRGHADHDDPPPTKPVEKEGE